MRRDAELDALREADAQARARSQTEFDRPLVLEAGAGTGKTATLVARVLAWCLGPGWRRAETELGAAAARAGRGGAVPAERIAAQVLEGVVAITFTEAAAAEMADRIARALDAIGKGELPVGLRSEVVAAAGEQARPRAAALLVALDHLVVATIHAFCRRMLAGAPLEAGVRPGFSVDADGQVLAAVVQEVVGNAFAAALRQGRRHPLVTLAALGRGPAETAASLELLAARAVPAAALSGDPADPRAVAELAAEVRRRADELRSLVAERVADLRRSSNAAKLAAAAASLAGCPDGPLEAIAAAVQAALPPALVAHLGKWRKGAFGNAEEERLAPVEDAVMRACGALAGLVGHLDRLDPALLRLAWEALSPLLGEVHARMRARGAETFAALLADAHELLVRHPSVRRAVRAGIAQLLVDEFQDTDVRQCEILRLLALDGDPAERPGLFLIGDPKQSIYGWRSADLEAYETFLAAVGEAGGEVLSLVVNFRSDPEILAEVERVLAPVMVREPGVQPEFQPLLPSPPPASGRPPLPPGLAPVEHWISWAADEIAAGRPEATSAQDAVELEARALALDLGALHRTGAMWREAAVLLRSTGDLDVYLQAFREAGVPYVVERDRSYYRRREVIEASALVRAVLDPGDHLALLTVLRSSIVGVPDAALIPLWERGLADRASGLSRPDAAVLQRLSADAAAVAAALPADVPGLERVRGWERNLTEFLAHLAELREAFEREPAAEFVERLRTATLFEASESARSVGAYRVANLDRFFRSLLAAMEAGDDLQAVLRALRVAVAEATEAEEGRPLASAEDAVRVMTIHKAKGLDFPHVYLMQAHRRSRSGVRPANDVESAGGR
ncbi:MAG TPA: UvrD-helicase domain-containing protein, partial [Thermoanaerobaculaceae bacterium]|nr:UvrD-helicase domain-containing protein [Thermoanaerobaculaceae bacterium]